MIFFFQAEDGIRDVAVTGVQTCALPICGQASDWSDPLKFIVATRGTGSQVAVSNLSAELLGGSLYLVRGRAEPGTTIKVSRSEERRVGKECRSHGSGEE